MLTSDLLGLKFRFPETHGQAELAIQFAQSLRIPDDGRAYPEPPSYGRLPLRHVEDYADRLPQAVAERGGMLLPMYQSDSLCISFLWSDIPMAVKIATGKLCAITGSEWDPYLHECPQDYVVVPNQKWMDGFLVAEGIVRQFVAEPLGDDLSVEKQLRGIEEVGGIQLLVYPMKLSSLTELRERERERKAREPQIEFSLSRSHKKQFIAMGAGGQLRQPIYNDPYGADVWDLDTSHRCFVTIANSDQWRSITHQSPPHRRLKPRHYRKHQIPWYDIYDEPSILRPTRLLMRIESTYKLLQERAKK